MELFDKDEFGRWMTQADYTLKSAENDMNGKFYSWACFKSQQAAEYALKALLSAIGEIPAGHSLSKLAEQLDENDFDCGEIKSACRRLDRLYIPTRYPDAYAEGSPNQYYEKKDATDAIGDARRIISFARKRAD